MIILIILVAGLLFCIYRLYRLYLIDKIRIRFCWCCSSCSSSDIFNITADLNIPKPYCIAVDEEEYLKEILKQFRKETTTSFLHLCCEMDSTYVEHGIDLLNKRMYAKFSTTEFFVLYLCRFLKKHEASPNFGDKELYTLKWQKVYNNSPLYLSYDAAYSLTEYGLVYQKLMYLCGIYIANRERFKKADIFYSPDGAKECIDKNEILISKM